VFDAMTADQHGMSLAEVKETFDLLDDWDQRYQYLIELGDKLPPLPDDLRTDDHLVKPCMSTVHVAASRDPAHPDHILFQGDCDTAVIKGVLALLIGLYSGHTLSEIQALDMDEIFEGLKLGENLSPNRHVGIYAIVDLMKSQAEKLPQQNSEVARTLM
jgi:cysteine desulfuration protein SufE